MVLAIAATQARANEARFVVAGVQKDACVTGADWTTKDGWRCLLRHRQYPVRRQTARSGDFVVQAELTIDKLGLVLQRRS